MVGVVVFCSMIIFISVVFILPLDELDLPHIRAVKPVPRVKTPTPVPSSPVAMQPEKTAEELLEENRRRMVEERAAFRKQWEADFRELGGEPKVQRCTRADHHQVEQMSMMGRVLASFCYDCENEKQQALEMKRKGIR